MFINPAIEARLPYTRVHCGNVQCGDVIWHWNAFELYLTEPLLVVEYDSDSQAITLFGMASKAIAENEKAEEWFDPRMCCFLADRDKFERYWKSKGDNEYVL